MFRSALRGATLRRPTVPPLTRKSNNPSDRALFSRIAFTGNIGIEPAVAVNDRTGRESIRYVVASPYGPRENRRTSWFRVTSFATGPTREYLLGIAKGTHVLVEGDITLGQFEDADGKKIPIVHIVERSIEVLRRSYRDFDGEPVDGTEGLTSQRQVHQQQQERQEQQRES